MKTISFKKLIPVLSIVCAVFILLLLSLQYPAALIFPMGGDSPPYIKSAQQILTAGDNYGSAFNAVKNSRYPLTVVIFTSISAILPMDDWPIRFIWVITLGQISAGLALGWLLYRLAEYLPRTPKWQMASIGMSVWAFTPIILNAHFRAGTLGQLWSLVFLLLFFERLLAKKPVGAAIMLIATLLTHPITAVVITVVMTTAVLPLWYLRKYLDSADKKILWHITAFSVFAGAMFLGYLNFIENPIRHIAQSDTFRIWQDYFFSLIAPFIVLSPLGFIILITKVKKINAGIFLLLVFCFLSFYLAFNDLIGFNIWTNRLHTFLILSIAILSSTALPVILRFFIKNLVIRSTAVIILLAITTFLVWEDQQKLYGSYATLNHYTGLDRVERRAVEWLGDNLPHGSTIITTNKQNRNAEWVPVLTDHEHLIRPPNHPLFTFEGKRLETRINRLSDHYFLFLLRREDPPQNMLDRDDLFSIIYQSSGAIVFKINEKDNDEKE